MATWSLEISPAKIADQSSKRRVSPFNLKKKLEILSRTVCASYGIENFELILVNRLTLPLSHSKLNMKRWINK